MLRTLALVAASAASAAAQPSTWLGVQLSTSKTNNVNILLLNNDGSIQKTLSTFPIGKESLDVDMFRCQPGGGYCSFVTTDPATGNSQLYNVSDVTGSEADTTPYPSGATAYSLHIDMGSGVVYSAASTNGGKGAAIVATDGSSSSILIDLTPSMPSGGKLHRGSATHCSDKKRMWVQFTVPGANATIVQVDLATPAVSASVVTNIEGFDALWAECDDQSGKNTVGGTIYTAPSSSGPGLLAYSVVTGDGPVVTANTGIIPDSTPPLVPTGLLSMAMTTQFFAALYPAGASPSNPQPGSLAQFNVAGAFTFTPISYFLAGAARYA
jgi:hypothetical protein